MLFGLVEAESSADQQSEKESRWSSWLREFGVVGFSTTTVLRQVIRQLSSLHACPEGGTSWTRPYSTPSTPKDKGNPPTVLAWGSAEKPLILSPPQVSLTHVHRRDHGRASLVDATSTSTKLRQASVFLQRFEMEPGACLSMCLLVPFLLSFAELHVAVQLASVF